MHPILLVILFIQLPPKYQNYFNSEMPILYKKWPFFSYISLNTLMPITRWRLPSWHWCHYWPLLILVSHCLFKRSKVLSPSYPWQTETCKTISVHTRMCVGRYHLHPLAQTSICMLCFSAAWPGKTILKRPGKQSLKSGWCKSFTWYLLHKIQWHGIF